MTPDRIRGWLHKRRSGAHTLELVAEQVVGEGVTIATWERDEIKDLQMPATGEPDATQQIMDLAQDHCDSIGESCSFRVRWVSESGRPVASITHKAAPQSDPDTPGADSAHLVTSNALVGQLLGHIERQQRTMSGSMGAVLGAYEKALALQGRLLEGAYEKIRTLESSKPDEALSEAKIQAWEKLADIAPAVAMKYIESRATPAKPSPLANGAVTPALEEIDDAH